MKRKCPQCQTVNDSNGEVTYGLPGEKNPKKTNLFRCRECGYNYESKIDGVEILDDLDEYLYPGAAQAFRDAEIPDMDTLRYWLDEDPQALRESVAGLGPKRLTRLQTLLAPKEA